MKLNVWCHITSKFGLIFILILSVLPAQAEVFKCTVNGKLTYSDKPCAENAESIELNYYKPRQEDIDRQLETTQRFEEGSRINKIEFIKEQNKRLQTQIKRANSQYDIDMAEMMKQGEVYKKGDKLYSKVHGLPEKIKQYKQNHQKTINRLQQQLSSNEKEIDRLSFRAQ
jgi:predicted RNase H-like nuclease (RuvC/YqgF family)